MSGKQQRSHIIVTNGGDSREKLKWNLNVGC